MSAKKIVVGLSGGVDSSTALLLLKKQGWQPVGVTLRLPVWGNKGDNLCCNPRSLGIAQELCQRLNVPYYILDTRQDFKRQVVDYFTSELKKGRTPNPCVICNQKLKFAKLFEITRRLGIDYVATGHYAQIKRNTGTGKYELLTAKDKNKDQSYYLAFLPQKWLAKIIFPLGEYTKEEVYKLAKKEGFNYWQRTKQSQDFCYLGSNSVVEFLEKEIGHKEGLIINTKGQVLGKHKGLHFYTLGQRQGIKLSGGPFYVKGFNSKNNYLIVTKNKNEILRKEIALFPYNLLITDLPKKKIRVQAKIRYRHSLSEAILYPGKNGKLKIVFIQPQLAVTPGQFCVFYLPARIRQLVEKTDQGEKCLGAGTIN